MKKTPLFNEHVKLGARMVPFAGFEMPIQYEGIIAEHNAVRQQAGLFDVSHMGEFYVTGKDSLAYLNFLTTNDVGKLTDGTAQYSLLCNEAGGVVDDILVYRLAPEQFLVVVNASNIEKDFRWCQQQTKNFNVTLTNKSDETALLALQGPQALAILQPLTATPLETIARFTFVQGATVAGQKNCTLSRTGYTGEDGVEIFCPATQAPAIWQALLETGTPKGLKPIGLGARDTLRLEARLSLYGHEITDEINPLEAGLQFFIKLDKTNFIGKTALLKVKEAGLTRKLVGFQMEERAIPREGSAIVAKGEKIGFVTSGSFSPTLQKSIGLGFVPIPFSAIGTKFDIDIRGKGKLAEVVKTPFYTRK